MRPTFPLLPVLLLAPLAMLEAAEFYVATNGADANRRVHIRPHPSATSETHSDIPHP